MKMIFILTALMMAVSVNVFAQDEDEEETEKGSKDNLLGTPCYLN